MLFDMIRMVNGHKPRKFCTFGVISPNGSFLMLIMRIKAEKGGIRGNEISCGFHANFLFVSG